MRTERGIGEEERILTVTVAGEEAVGFADWEQGVI